MHPDNSSNVGLFPGVRIVVMALAIGLVPVSAVARDPHAFNRQLHLSTQEVHERCVDLAPGQQLDYSFKATQSVDFSIRYRESDRIMIPVSRKARSGKGKFTARAEASYCVTLGNFNARGANAFYQYSIRDAKPSRHSRR